MGLLSPQVSLINVVSLSRSPKDADLLSKVGYVQLQLGDLLGAQKTFSQVEALLTDSFNDDLANVVGRNRGLLHFAEKQYTKAFNEFSSVLDRNPHDTVSANNKVSFSELPLDRCHAYGFDSNHKPCPN